MRSRVCTSAATTGGMSPASIRLSSTTAEVGVGHEVLAVVDHDQRIGAARDRARPAGRPARRGSRRRRALDRRAPRCGRRRAARLAPGRAGVAEGAGDRVLAERIAGARRVQRIDDPVLARRRARSRACTRTARRPRPAAAAARGRSRAPARTAGGRPRRGSSASGARGPPRPRQAKVSAPGSARGNSCPARKASIASGFGPAREQRRQRRVRPSPSGGGQSVCTFMLEPPLGLLFRACRRGRRFATPRLHARCHASLIYRAPVSGNDMLRRNSPSRRAQLVPGGGPSGCADCSISQSTTAALRLVLVGAPLQRARCRPGAGGRRWCRGGR